MYFHIRGFFQLRIIHVAIIVLPKRKLGFQHIQKTLSCKHLKLKTSAISICWKFSKRKKNNESKTIWQFSRVHVCLSVTLFFITSSLPQCYGAVSLPPSAPHCIFSQASTWRAVAIA